MRFIGFDFVLKWGKWNFFVMFCLCSTEALRRAAAQPGGGGCHERKAVFMIKRVCLGNNRQLYFYVQNIQREVQRRAAPLLVWRRAKISLRMVCAALRRKPSGGIMRVKNEFIIERK